MNSENGHPNQDDFENWKRMNKANLTPEVLAWILEQDTEEEIIAGIKEARESPGPELGEVIRQLEKEFGERERTSP